MHFKKTKIIATVGPACEKEEVLEKIIMAGANCIRLNFSHGNYDWHGGMIDKVRKIEKKLKKHIAIIADIQGPKIRVGSMPKEGIVLEDGQKVTIDTSKKEYTGTFIPLPSTTFKEGVKEGATVFLDDGLLSLKITKKEGSTFHATVIKGGILTSNKGANIPSLVNTRSVFNDKDRADIAFAVKAGADYVAVSFIGSAKDINEAKSIIKNPAVKVIAKIERPEALENLDEIIDATDAVMVARGDLGIETPIWELPVRQKEIIYKVREKMKPVIVATQMLDSMIRNPLPTRAEVSDVANAVYDSADCVMLSGETASGKNPVESVEMMRKVLELTDDHQIYFRGEEEEYESSYIYIAKSAADIASELNAKVILIKTASGRSALTVSNFRPDSMIIGITQDEMVARQLSLVWGILPMHITAKTIKKIDDFVLPTIPQLKKDGVIESGDLTVCMYDDAFQSPEKTVANSISIKSI